MKGVSFLEQAPVLVLEAAASTVRRVSIYSKYSIHTHTHTHTNCIGGSFKLLIGVGGVQVSYCLFKSMCSYDAGQRPLGAAPY
jgi:hypothetical protein